MIGRTSPLSRTPKKGKSKRGALSFASLNIKGRNSSSTMTKWCELCQLMREKKINILAVQETHIDARKREEIEELFQRQMRILTSSDPEYPNVMGVAFILNKQTTRWPEARS